MPFFNRKETDFRVNASQFQGGIVCAFLFYAGYVLFTVFWGTLSVVVGWTMPRRRRFEFIIGIWTRGVLGWLRLTCGVGVKVEGLQHIPRQACVVFAHHESTWETLFLQSLFRPQATLIKRELLWIPFFGWAFALNRPIAIDRGSPRRALRKLIDTGRSRLAEGVSVVLFPEGTRMPPGEVGSFQPGGAALAIAAEAPVVVVAHNAGRHWPAHRLRKTPGVIRVRIGPPVATAGRKTKAVSDEARALMASLVKRLN